MKEMHEILMTIDDSGTYQAMDYNGFAAETKYQIAMCSSE